MLAKRIVPCLDVADGRVVKGVNFFNLRDAGDPVELARRYSDAGADELVFLDISATHEGRDILIDTVERTAREVFVPLTVGGGIGSVDQARRLLHAGADKVSVNSAAVKRPELVTDLAEEFGSQAVVVAVDARWEGQCWRVTIHGGRITTERDALDWVREATGCGAGEVLLTSMDTDGVKTGFDTALTRAVVDAVTVPVVASGGAGSREHFLQVFQETECHAALAASVFHFGEIEILELKAYLAANGIPVRPGS